MKSNNNSDSPIEEKSDVSIEDAGKEEGRPSKGPLSYFSGAVTSLLLAWVSLAVSRRAVAYFVAHQPNYSSAIAQSIASGLKTLVIGMTFLATFTFAFIGLGLTLVFLRSLLGGNRIDSA